MKQYDVIVLGAGASGLMCAATAGARGKHVLVIDHEREPGRKILVTGGGKCNVTNKEISYEHYTGVNPQFTRSALAQFTSADMQELLQKHHIALEEREEGQLFCKHSAEEFLQLLLTECKKHHVTLSFGQEITEVVANEEGYVVNTAIDRFTAASVVVALGGTAWPQIGATDYGYRIAKHFGHKLIEPRPALVGLVMLHNWELADLAGISLRVTLEHITSQDVYPASSKAGAKPKGCIVANNLPLLFTHKGISGPAGLQASLYWKKGDMFICNFLPGIDIQKLLAAPENGKLLLKTVIKRLLPSRLADVLMDAAVADKKIAELSKVQRSQLQQRLQEWAFIPERTEGIKKAEVTVGGVSTEQISSQSMESKLAKGLFFCGEVLDVTGRLGGYNIHWAIASGLAAGKYA